MIKWLNLVIFIAIIMLADCIFLIFIYQKQTNIKREYSTPQDYNYILSNSEDYNKIIEKYLNDEHEKWLLKYENDGKCFSKCEYFGELDNYVFVECFDECYTYTNNELESISGSLSSYKVLINNGNVNNYETPLDTEVYDESMHRIFPSKVVDKMYKYDAKNIVSDVRKQVKEYFGVVTS